MKSENMIKKKILIVCNSFYPVIAPRSFRATELAKELSKKGHEVTVCFPTKDFDYHDFMQKYHLKILDLGSLKFKGIPLKGQRIELYLRRIIKRIMQILIEWPDIQLMFMVKKKLKRLRGFDLLISIAVPYPIHWGVASIYKSSNKIAKCWIADCGDPYMGDTADSFRKLFYFKYLEKWFCRRANYITVPFDGAISAYYPEFHYKIKIIPQGFEIDNIKIKQYEKLTNYPVFAYTGGFIPGKRDPRNFLTFISKLNRDFKFFVFTKHEELLLSFKEVLFEKLEIRKYIPREELLEILSGMDFLINFDNNIKTQLPSKLIDYIITGRPVLNIASNDDFKIFEEFLDGNYKNKMQLPSLKNYDIKIVADKFLSLMY